jgi:hypothetical protein
MLVREGDAAIVLVFKLVCFGIGRGVAPQPELLDKFVARSWSLFSFENSVRS